MRDSCSSFSSFLLRSLSLFFLLATASFSNGQTGVPDIAVPPSGNPPAKVEPTEAAPDDMTNGEPSDQDLGKLPSEEVGQLNPNLNPTVPLSTVNDSSFRDVAKELRCPTCTGLSILESDASFSVQIKDQVREQMELGKSKGQILNFFVERYGPWILREPPKEGFNILAWLIPILLLCLGPILIWLLVWKRRVQANSHGVRSNEKIIAEMQEQLQFLKQKGG